ncbi:MAG: Co2+/Mg2+ efflux protein ApaG [Deltaproteobacteria bacterium]|nr:MAG: Co2+/Mg2+ efflux protein ApaG [Deltaproteobacteria bacterium]
MSEAVTRGVRVRVEAHFDPDRSHAQRNLFFFLYSVEIANQGRETVQLLSRHWLITDGTGRVQEVRGAGVVGKQPRLEAGQTFRYTSGCPLSTPMGSMRGSYQMVTDGGTHFDAEIASFDLIQPHAIH